MATVIINSDLSANPSTVSVKAEEETVTWVGDSEFTIHLPAPYTNPNISPNGGRWSGTSGKFPRQAQGYTVHYSVSRNNQMHDPDIDVIP